MTKIRTEPMSRHRLDEIGWTEWTEKTPAETGAIVLELINEVKRQRALVDETLVSSTTVGDILEKRLDGVPNVDPQYLADEITTTLYRRLKGIDR